MEKRKIEISEFVEEDLIEACNYYEEHYSTRYAEQFRKEFYEEVKAILLCNHSLMMVETLPTL